MPVFKKRLDLTHVYIDLNTKTTKNKDRQKTEAIDSDEKQKPIPVLEAVGSNRKAVILGDPGSGKSTFVNYLATRFALEGDEKKDDWISNESDLLPISVTLRDFARQIDTTLQPESNVLWQFILKGLEKNNLTYISDVLLQKLDEGKCIILLDGLDEVPTSEQKTFIRDTINNFGNRFSKNRFLVTCRTLSYEDPGM